MSTSSRGGPPSSPSRSMQSSQQQRKAAHAVELEATRRRLAELATKSSTGSRTSRLYLGQRRVKPSAIISPRAASKSPPTDEVRGGMVIPGAESFLEEAAIACMLEAIRVDPSLLSTPQRPGSRSSAGGSRQSSRRGGGGGADDGSGAASRRGSSVVIRRRESTSNAASMSQATEPCTAAGVSAQYTISPQTLLALFRAHAVSMRLFTFVLLRDPAKTALVLSARRRLHNAEVQRTLARLERDAISLPITTERMVVERRLTLGRDIAKGVFHSNIFLSQHPSLDPRAAFLKRRMMFQDSVDATIEFLVQWEDQPRGHKRDKSPPSASGRKGRRALKRQQSSGESPVVRRPSFVMTESLQARRLVRRSSLSNLMRSSSVTIGSTTHHFTGVLDVQAIKQKKYPAQEVIDHIKRYQAEAAANASRRGGRNGQQQGGSTTPSRRRAHSPTSCARPQRKQHSPTSSTAVSWVNQDILEYLSPVTPGSLSDQSRWADITEGVFEASVAATRGLPHVSIKTDQDASASSAPPYLGNDRTSKVLALLEAMPSSAFLSRSKGNHRVADRRNAREPSASPSRKSNVSSSFSHPSSTRLAPLPRDVQMAAAQLQPSTTSHVLDSLLELEKNVQGGYEARNKDVRFWFGTQKGRLPLDRVTSSLRMRQLSPQVLSFFDGHGLIDGRPDNVEDSRPRDGVVYSAERIVATRRAAALNELKDVAKRRRRQPMNERSNDSRNEENDDVDQVLSGNGSTQDKSESNNNNNSSGTQVKRKLSAISEYHGPNHRHDSNEPSHRGPPVPSVERLRELLSTVFVRGGDVRTYTKKIEREAKLGLKQADIRQSHKDRLGGGSVPRSVLKP